MKTEVFFQSEKDCALGLCYCGTEICEPDFVMKPHVRREYLIHYCLAGSGRFRTPQGEFVLKTGDLFLIRPGQVVSYETDRMDPLQFSWFSFTGNQASKITQWMGFGQDRCVMHLHSRFSIHQAVMECISLLSGTQPPNGLRIQARLYEMLGLIHESHMADERMPYGQRNVVTEHVQKSIAYMKMNYMNPITVADVVAYVRLERTYFSKIFKAVTGKTPQEYLLEVRLEQAKILLEQTNYSAKEISSFVGFADESYFSRAFRKKTGVPPNQYRINVK